MVFVTLHKAIDKREEQKICDIKEETYKREKALEVYTLMCLGRRLICLHIMKHRN